uniref:Chemosensory protein n=1 Tax=Blattella germanica TaxID=6973 RepID=A0A0X8DBQ5_BLAGE|nr:chemosensory protein [Blattella germanica]
MLTTLICFLGSLLLAFAKPTFPQSPSTAEMSNDLALIRLCNQTSPISLATMNSVLINKQLSGVSNAEGFKCFLHCLYNNYNWMDEDGGFMLSNMKGSLEATRLDELSIEFLIYKCTSVDSSDRCERAFKFTECFWSETKTFPDESAAVDSSDYRIDWAAK